MGEKDDILFVKVFPIISFESGVYRGVEVNWKIRLHVYHAVSVAKKREKSFQVVFSKWSC